MRLGTSGSFSTVTRNLSPTRKAAPCVPSDWIIPTWHSPRSSGAASAAPCAALLRRQRFRWRGQQLQQARKRASRGESEPPSGSPDHPALHRGRTERQPRRLRRRSLGLLYHDGRLRVTAIELRLLAFWA